MNKINKSIVLKEVNEKEFYNVINSDFHKRVKYFKNRVAGKETMWLMGSDDSFFTDLDNNGNEVLLVWPYKEYAEYTVFENTTFVSQLVEVEIHDFLETCISYLQEKNIKLMVFPVKEGSGCALFNPEDFRIMMEEELSKYGDYDDEYEEEGNSLERRLGKNTNWIVHHQKK